MGEPGAMARLLSSVNRRVGQAAQIDRAGVAMNSAATDAAGGEVVTDRAERVGVEELE